MKKDNFVECKQLVLYHALCFILQHKTNNYFSDR